MPFSSWLRNWMPTSTLERRRAHVDARKPASVRPRLEALEGRDVPSTLTVTNNQSFGPGSLQAEIAAAQSGDTIVFAKGIGSRIFVGSVGLGGVTEFEINKNLDIEGPGANKLAISGGLGSRVFDVDAGVQVTLSGLTIENGNGTTGAFDPDPDDGKGGGILNFGTLTVSNCTVTGNDDMGSGIPSLDLGGGIYNAGTLTVSGSTVTGNTAGSGGGIYNTGTLAVLYSTVIHNSAFDGADLFTDGQFTMSHSKIGKVAYF